MSDRPNLLVAATVGDAIQVKREFWQFTSWHVATPRNAAERGWLYRYYTWTPKAKKLLARTRWDLKQRLVYVTDEESEEKDFPTKGRSW